jgi:hypothetical protein
LPMLITSCASVTNNLRQRCLAPTPFGYF